MKNIIFTLSLLIIFSMSLSAQIVTDRPDQTESSSTVPGGALQIESGILVQYQGEGPVSNRQILAPTNLFRYGIGEKVELRLLSQFENFHNGFKSVSGISDLEIGTKVQLFKKEGSKNEVAFLGHLRVPSGSTELSSDEYGLITKLCITNTISDDFSIAYNIGYNQFDDFGELFYSLAFGIAVNDKVGIYFEPYGNVVDLEFEDTILNFDAGFTYLPNPNVQLDFSFGTGINDTMNYLSVGCSWLIPKTSE